LVKETGVQKHKKRDQRRTANCAGSEMPQVPSIRRGGETLGAPLDHSKKKQNIDSRKKEKRKKKKRHHG